MQALQVSYTLPFKQHILQSSPYKGGSTRQANQPLLYKLSSNENMLGPSPKALEAIQHNLGLINEYAHENDIQLRQALAAHVDERLHADQFVTGNSGLELIEVIVRGFVSPGTEIILSSPTFMAYANVAKLGGAAVIDVPLNAGNYSVNVQGILAAVTDNTRLVFVCNPNNPTGTFAGRAALHELIDGLPPHVVVVYDEVYHDYVETPDFPLAVEYIVEGKPVIGLRSFSKSYGLAGLRIGYAYATDEIASYLQRIRRPFMINALSTEAAIAALSDEAHLAATKAMNQQGKQQLYKGFTACGINYWPTEANFILIQPPIAAKDFVQALLQQGIMVRDAEVMRAPGLVRITIGNAEANAFLINTILKQPWAIN